MEGHKSNIIILRKKKILSNKSNKTQPTCLKMGDMIINDKKNSEEFNNFFEQ